MDNYNFQDLIKNTEQKLNNVEIINDIITENEGKFTDVNITRIIEKYSISTSDNIQLDGCASINISEDKMSVYADFYPPSTNKNPITLEKVLTKLSEKKIIFGINNEKIKESVFKCNTEKIILKKVLIAQGKEHKNTILKFIKINEDLLQNCCYNNNETDNIDYHEYKGYITVNKGQELASINPLIEGFEGTNVFGEIIPYDRIMKNNINPGKNTTFIKDKIIASCDGIFKSNSEFFWVEKVFIIDGDVDYKIGNVDFSGDVIVKGNVLDLFKIKAKGDIFCNNTLDATEIYGEKNLFVKKGIIGRNKGVIKIHESIRARFIEHCYVESEDSIYIEKGAINSILNTKNKIITSVNGQIIGGTIYAINGIVVTQIGTETGPKTEIYCGTDFDIANKMDWIKEKIIDLGKQLKKVQLELKNNSLNSSQLTMLMNYESNLQCALHKLNDTAISLLTKIDKNSEADIIVRGSIYPNTYINICHVPFTVKKVLKSVRIRLDKREGKIVIDKIKCNT